MSAGPDDAFEPPPSEPIPVRFFWGPDAWVTAQTLHFRSHPRPIGWRLLIGALVLFYAALTLGFPLGVVIHRGLDSEAGRRCAILFGVAAAFWAWAIYARRRKLALKKHGRRAFQDLSIGAHWVDWTVDRYQLSSQTKHTSATMSWQMILKAVEGRPGFLLYQSTRFFHWFPASGFQSEEDMHRFGALVRERVADFRHHAPAAYPGRPESESRDDF